MNRLLLSDAALAPVLAALPQARLVGGCVRDMLANRAIVDVDLATPEPPPEILRAIEAAGLRAVPTGIAHGTITAISGGRPFEITTLRRDVKTDGRHAEVAWTQDWREDAARRDFTINAMSLARDGVLHDYFGGQADLAAGHVRFVGDAATRIAEDALRVLRFFRFHGRYGRGRPDADAARAIGTSLEGLRRLSPERVWSELKRILTPEDPVAAMSLMDELGVLSVILPEARNIAALARLMATEAPADPLLRLGALLCGDAASLALRLRFSTAERERLVSMRAGPTPTDDADDADLRRLLAGEPAASLMDRSFLAGGSPHVRSRLQSMQRPQFPLEGRDVLALGVPPGPGVGALLAEVRAWWLEGGCLAERSACLACLLSLVA